MCSCKCTGQKVDLHGGKMRCQVYEAGSMANAQLMNHHDSFCTFIEQVDLRQPRFELLRRISFPYNEDA